MKYSIVRWILQLQIESYKFIEILDGFSLLVLIEFLKTLKIFETLLIAWHMHFDIFDNIFFDCNPSCI